MMALRSRGELDDSGQEAESPQAIQYGNEHGAFEISVDRSDRIARMKLRGVWDIATAEAFCGAILGIGRDLAGRPWAILADSSEFRVQSPEVARLRQETMVKLRTLRCEKIASVASNAVHAMQFKRIAADSHVGSGVFPDEKSALDWIHEGRDHGKKSQPISATQPIDPRRNRLQDR
ncbi:MAG TPA: hypothetical protein VGY54_25565 [Polyangiaceae bacterium]|jgi:hypothetical protein|nr:hypothetical protein [Polyangiaceae bacterium]